MPISIDGTGTITGLSAGGLPDNCITTAEIAGSAVTSAKLAQPMTLGTAQSASSGTAVDFTGIPSWAKRITVMFNGVSTSGTNTILVQAGSGTTQSTGYNSTCCGCISGVAQSLFASTSGFIVYNDNAGDIRSGNLFINLLGSNIYTSSHNLGCVSARNVAFWGGGAVSLSGVLDRVRISTTATDTFDGSGSINIMYEG
jgi:hypothetical protein